MYLFEGRNYLKEENVVFKFSSSMKRDKKIGKHQIKESLSIILNFLQDGRVIENQMKRLRNGQGLPVKTACGGYNCRHSWTPVTEGFIKAANLKRAKGADITKANQ